VFLALEGRVQSAPHGSSGFSYHLGNSENRVWVDLPIQFDGKRHRTVRVNVDVARLFDTNGVSPWRDGTSTHSRAGDPVLAPLKLALANAFSIGAVTTDHFQELFTLTATNAPASRTAGTPARLQISARLPKVNLPADNLATVEGVALGQRLFHETRLSRNNQISCASCHQRENAFSDPARFSLGVDGRLGKRHAMPLFNLAWQKDFFWDGRVTGLRHQVLHPIQDTNEMAASLERVVSGLQRHDEYPKLFQKAFGDRTVTSERIGLALEQFLLTLVSQDSRFDRAARGEMELTDAERRGLALFITENDPARGLRGADCFHCHGGNLFTSGAFANNGLDSTFADPGRYAVTKNEADRGKFRVPSLRNVALTAPYMHDGRFATLEDVVEHYNSGVRPSSTLDPNLAKHPNLGLSLSESDKKDLVAFLRTLTDESFLKSQSTATRQTLTLK
jgi:cytochrome c peroxidase